MNHPHWVHISGIVGSDPFASIHLSMYAKQKRQQDFKATDVLVAIKTIQTIIERETNMEKTCLY
jgi:hypothetical protein